MLLVHATVIIIIITIEDTIFCANVVSQKCAQASQLLSQIEEVGSVDPQVALLLLRMCGAF